MDDDRRVGVVVIGRNEGERLRRCLRSVAGGDVKVVYVDSASTDGSIELARSMGAEIVELDMSRPFTAARARNVGYRRLRELLPNVEVVQFVDGDCEIAGGWLEAAESAVREASRRAVVCGRLRERHPEESVYSQLCDLEWGGPVGPIDACGGIFMIRVEAFDAVGGMDDAVAAGEEPEMCIRLRREGWTIHRIAHEMGLHEAGIERFGQWWRRAARGGRAHAHVIALHGAGALPSWGRAARSAWAWGVGLPLAAFVPGVWTHGASLLLLALYPLWVVKIARWLRSERGTPWRPALWYGLFCMVAKWAELSGQISFRLGRRRRTPSG